MARVWSLGDRYCGFRPYLLLLAACGVLLGTHMLGADEAEGAFVMEISGGWHFAASTRTAVRLHDHLRGGATVVADQPDAAGVLTLMLRDGTTLRRSCSAKAPCRDGVHVPSTVEASPSFSEFLLALWARIGGPHETHYVTTSARCLGPQDAVISLPNRRVQLAPAFSELVKGSYQIQLTPVAKNAAKDLQVQVEWDGTSAEAPASGIGPGLYVVRLVASGEQVYVLVASDRASAHAQSIFAAVDGKTRAWEGVPARVRSEVRRAALEQLAQEMDRPK